LRIALRLKCRSTRNRAAAAANSSETRGIGRNNLPASNYTYEKIRTIKT
jgi:hypothetical protein